MKLSPRDAPGYFARPDPKATGLLIFGQDGMRVALKRQDVVKALVGPQGEDTTANVFETGSVLTLG